MWEDATPKPAEDPRPESRPKKPAKTGEDLVLWSQIILCALALGAAFAGKTLGLPFYPALRAAYTGALQQEEWPLFPEERSFAKFAQETTASLRAAVEQVAGELRATGETARRRPAHGKPLPAPAGSSNETYLPDLAFVSPLPGGTDTHTSEYGWRIDPVTGEGDEFHTGVDLAAAEGTPVYAAADGVVRLAAVHKSYGNYLRILHAGGDETLYAHMQYLFVRPGEPVKAGQCIGTSGQTGNVTGPHLHFEILHEGVRYDPAEVLRAVS